MKILIVDDEPDILGLLRHFLSSKNRTVVAADNGQKALEIFAQEQPDLIILDVMMPGLNGWDVLERIRQMSQVPVIMLTAKDTPMHTAKGLLSGADDYMAKPFDLGELEARITAVMRRYKSSNQMAGEVSIANITINDNTKEVTLNGEPARLSPKEYELLRLLASQPGKVFSHKEIIAEVWQGKHFVNSKDVIKYINLLRNKLEQNPKAPKLIINVRGFGYKLQA